MSLVDIETAKQHLRADGDEENGLIALYLSAAELSAVEFLNRKIYADQAALDAAKAAIPAALDAAEVAYDAACAAADASLTVMARELRRSAAEADLGRQQANAAEVLAGVLTNDTIQAAILLILGHLYANREEVVPGTVSKIPFGAHALLQPYRVGLGV